MCLPCVRHAPRDSIHGRLASSYRPKLLITLTFRCQCSVIGRNCWFFFQFLSQAVISMQRNWLYWWLSCWMSFSWLIAHLSLNLLVTILPQPDLWRANVSAGEMFRSHSLGSLLILRHPALCLPWEGPHFKRASGYEYFHGLRHGPANIGRSTWSICWLLALLYNYLLIKCFFLSVKNVDLCYSSWVWCSSSYDLEELPPRAAGEWASAARWSTGEHAWTRCGRVQGYEGGRLASVS